MIMYRSNQRIVYCLVLLLQQQQMVNNFCMQICPTLLIEKLLVCFSAGASRGGYNKGKCVKVY